jgi:hypothetical protein
VPAWVASIVQVAVPELSVLVACVHEVAPADPLTTQVMLPVGTAAPAGPETVAVNVTVLPSVIGPESVTASDGVVLAIVMLPLPEEGA